MLTRLLILLLFVSPALSHDHGEHTDFLRSLTLPDTGGSCCNEKDCRLIDSHEWQIKDGDYQVHHEGRWLVVPASRILKRQSPDGRAVACVLNNLVVCFVVGQLV
jgi:hypothetical protein